MKPPKRSRRRHDLARMKERAKRVYSDNKPENAIKLANHIKCCSCWACGNPRRHFDEPTVQELRQGVQ